MIKIFSDRHHDGLAYSLRLLAKRLDADIYFPIGEEWFTKGFWKIAEPYQNNPDTIKQYLALDHRYIPKDGTPSLNIIKNQYPTYYEIEDLAHGDILKAITFEQFLEMDIDVIIASIPAHWIAYTKLRNQYKPKAKVICQMGNMFNEVYELLVSNVIRNLMASTIPFNTPSMTNTIFYHQEIPIIDYTPPKRKKRIYSFVNILPKPGLFQEYKQRLSPEFEMKAYGASCPDGWVNGIFKQYETMQQADFGYHVKPMGDGFGWVWHSWFMVGRPVITNFSDYKDKLGGLLFEHLVTGIDLDCGTIEENSRIIKKYSDPQLLEMMCQTARERFDEVVNYEQEFFKIKKFFENLI